MASEQQIVDSIKASVESLKYKYERQEAINSLSTAEMTVRRLNETKAGQKITNVFRSSRFSQSARAVHAKWIADADKEIQERWNELKHVFLSKEQIRMLERQQAKYNKLHGIMEPLPSQPTPSSSTNWPRISGGRDSFDIPSSSSTSHRDKENDKRSGAAFRFGQAAMEIDPATNFVAYNYSTPVVRRARGRPRSNVFPGRGDGFKRRGRPPTRR